MQFGAAALTLEHDRPASDLIVGAPGAGDGAGAFYVYEGDRHVLLGTMRDYMRPKRSR